MLKKEVIFMKAVAANTSAMMPAEIRTDYTKP